MVSVYRSRTSPQQRPLSSWVLYPSSSSSSSLRTPWAVTMPPPLSSQPQPRAAVTWWPVPSQRHSWQEPKVQHTRESDYERFVARFWWILLNKNSHDETFLWRVSKIFTMGPAGMTKSSLSPYGTTGREWSTIVKWTPTKSQAGYHILCYSAEINSK